MRHTQNVTRPFGERQLDARTYNPDVGQQLTAAAQTQRGPSRLGRCGLGGLECFDGATEDRQRANV
eukprot:6848088-Prymnesium_polylepis.2